MIKITDAELIDLMEGHMPPEDPEQLAAYVDVAEKRIATRYPEENMVFLGLIRGLLPEFFWEAKRKVGS